MRHCCLCGLLCSLDRAATSACPRRRQWLEHAVLHTAAQVDSQVDSQVAATAAQQASQAEVGGWRTSVGLPAASGLTARIETLAAQLQVSRQPLIWIDAADVHTLRCAVALAQAVRGTIHVGLSTGAAASHRVLTSQGWLGSSLAEVASHADLIISLGGGLQAEAPLLAPRFFAPALNGDRAQWWHIDSHAANSQAANSQAANSLAADSSSDLQPSPTWTAVWPRAEWYAQLTLVMLGLQDDSVRADAVAGQMHESTRALLGKLRSAKNTVWLWDVDEFRDAIDELCIQRLLGISRLLSQTARCGLLGLDAQVGRVTAMETLLWLTGCSGTAQFDGQRWSQPHALSELALEDWSGVFDSILVVRSLPSVYPLPSLPEAQFLVTEPSLLPDHVSYEKVTTVASVGVDRAGHVMRGDRATLLYCPADTAPSPSTTMTSRLPTAGELLQHLRQRLQAGGVLHAH